MALAIFIFKQKEYTKPNYCDLDIAIDSGWIGRKCAEVRTRDKISLGVIHILQLTLTLLKYHSNSIPFN